MPKVSVIIPIYNSGQYLSRCLDSVVNQTFSDLEVICVNDGSTDNSGEILGQYAKQDKRIKVINQMNAGPSAARNVGLKHVSGEYISFIDSDDWIDAEYYECLLNLMEQHNADIVMAGMRVVNEQDVSDNKTPNLVTDIFTEKVKYLPNGSTCDKLFKSWLFENIEFPIGRYYEDNIVLVKVVYKSKIMVFSNSVSYYYFMNKSGTCRTHNQDILKKREADRLYFAREILNFVQSRNCYKLDEVKSFLLRTVLDGFISKKSKHYRETKQILGCFYVCKIKTKRLLGRLLTHLYKCKKILINRG